MPWRLMLVLGLVPGPVVGPHVAAADPKPDPAKAEYFEKRVRPLLADHCQQCHGPDKQKGGLRLDSRAALLAGGDSGPAVVPGKPGESRLVKAVGYDGDLRMPPKTRLDANQVAVLTAWVEMGAPWPEVAGARPVTSGSTLKVTAEDREFWSFRPVREPNVPAVRDESWPRSPIDRFVLAKLEEKGLRPVAPADKRTLIRRASFDLIGLPPTPEEVEAFLADDSPDAFERWSSGCWRRRPTASGGAGTGSTSPATARTRRTPSRPASTPTATATATGW